VYVLELLGIAACTLFTAFFQYYTLQEVQTFLEAFEFRAFRLHVLGLSFFPGYVAAFALQVAYLRLIWVTLLKITVTHWLHHCNTLLSSLQNTL